MTLLSSAYAMTLMPRLPKRIKISFISTLIYISDITPLGGVQSLEVCDKIELFSLYKNISKGARNVLI